TLLSIGVKEVVVHQGGLGATAFTRTGVQSARANPVSSVNPTGCGDVFNAAYIRAMLAGADLARRLRFANAAAAWHLETLSKPYPTMRDLRSRFSVSLSEGLRTHR
ncbi:MAG: PfkB family carbohydrate kinase, partial [Candidatus Thermoplasmatota archaeon]